MRRSEPRIVDPATHPKRYVSVAVAAAWLEEDERWLRECIRQGLLEVSYRGRRIKIHIPDLLAFEQSLKRRAS
jgi:hypothetical protein